MQQSTTIQQIREFMNEMLVGHSATNGVVSELDQQHELERLTKGRREEQFFFVVDLQRVELTVAVGWAEMGYQDETFSFHAYLNMIPNKAVSELLLIMGKQAYRLSAKLGIIRFMKPKYISQIPLKHRDGRVFLCKRTISGWQISESNLVLAYLSEFTILKIYESEPLNPRFLGLDNVVKDVFKRMVSQVFFQQPSHKNPFAPREQQLLRLHLENPDIVLTANDVADRLNTKTSTIQDYNKQIIRKSRQHFGDDLPVQTARDVAFYLHKNGLLG